MPQGPFLREYGTEAKIPFVLFEVDGVDFRSDATPATADATIMIDEGAEASATNIYVDEGIGYSITLTATEMLGARIVVYMVDAATKAFLDDSLIIETYGSASAMHQFPFGTATVTVGVNNDKTGYFPATGALSAGTFGADALTAGTIADGAIDNTALAAGAITASAFAANALTAGTIADGAIDAATFAAGAIDAAAIATDAIDSDAVAAGTITSGTFAANAITGSAIAAGAIDNTTFAADAITGSAIADDAVIAVSAGTNVIVANMAAGVMSAGAFAASAITASALAANSITNAKLADGAIASDTFAASALTASAVAAATIDLIWDEVVDGTTTARSSLVISNTLLAGKVSGGSSTTATFRDIADSKDRIVIIYTVDGDKTSVTFSDIAA